MSTNRRRFLQTMGVAGGGLFLPSLQQSSSRAQPAGPPLRMLIYYTPFGTMPDRWRFRPSGPATASEDWEFDLASVDRSQWSEGLEPLYDFRDHLTVVDGLGYRSWLEPGSSGSGHLRGTACNLTGNMVRRDPDDPSVSVGKERWSTSGISSSVDQIIADRIQTPSGIHSVNVSLQNTNNLSPIWNGTSWIDNTVGIPEVYSALFGHLPPPGSGPDADARAAALLRARSRSYQVAQQHYDQMIPRMSSLDQTNLTAYRDAIADVERRVSGALALNCDTPEEPDRYLNTVSSNTNNWGPGEAEYRMRTIHRMVTTAFACDLTRVAAIGPPPFNTSWIEASGEFHDDVQHSSLDNPVAQDAAMRYWREILSLGFYWLLDELAAIPEGDGTLLDNTIVYWVSENGTGWHTGNRLPIVLAGGGGRHVRTGTYLHYAENKEFHTHGMCGPSVNHLLVSLVNRFGEAYGDDVLANQDVVGMAEESDGDSLRGALPRLMV